MSSNTMKVKACCSPLLQSRSKLGLGPSVAARRCAFLLASVLWSLTDLSTQKKTFRAQKSKQPHRNMREQADSEDEDEMGEVNTKKRRTRKTRAKMSKKKIEDDDGGEVFDLDDEQGARYVEPTQLGFYNGEKKLVITRGIFFVRLFLFNVNTYPDKAELEEWSAKGYRAGAQLTYGINYEGGVCLGSVSHSY